MSSSNGSHTVETRITTEDLERILQVFDIAARRGAFTVEEFSEIGSLYSNLKRFIVASSGSNSANIVGSIETGAKLAPP